MNFEVLILYVVAIFIVILIPGPLSLFMVSNALKHGILKSYPAFLGGTTASSLYLLMSATGLGALLAFYDNVFTALKLLGALYLVYLGIMTIRAAMKAVTVHADIESNEKFNFSGMFKKAFLLGASNPKDIIFFMAFLPQFIVGDENLALQISIIILIWIAVDAICKILYGLLAKTIRPFITTPKSFAAFNKLTGILYVIAGVVAVLVV